MVLGLRFWILAKVETCIISAITNSKRKYTYNSQYKYGSLHFLFSRTGLGGAQYVFLVTSFCEYMIHNIIRNLTAIRMITYTSSVSL